MQVIDGFRTLLSVDRIAWGDGAGWLLGLVLLWFVSVIWTMTRH